MNYHEDGYGGGWYYDNPFTHDDPYYDCDWDDAPDYDYDDYHPQTLRQQAANKLRWTLHALRYRFSKKYRTRVDSLPF